MAPGATSGAWSEGAVRELAAQHRDRRGPLIEILHAVQHRFGCIDPRTVAVLADELNLSRAEVHGVITFYRDFREAPLTAPLVRVCRAEACQARGGEAVAEHARAAAALQPPAFVLEDVYCLGNCALGPSVEAAGRLHAGVDVDRFDRIVAGVTATSPATDSAIRRQVATTVVRVPADSAARSVGSDEVAEAITNEAAARGLEVHIVRTGSRGMLWLEPLVEVEVDGRRVGYGPVGVDDVGPLLDAGLTEGHAHPLRLGPIDDLPWYARQQRVTFRRVGVIDPLSPTEYEANGGLAGLRRALALEPAAVVAEVTDSGLRGRGGAGFPAGIKWRTVLDAPGGQKYVCINADEGDSGTFADRMLMEGDPFLVIEGAAIAARAVGATEGFVYIRSEYPEAIARMREAITVARERGWLGPRVLGSDLCFDLEVRAGAGSYVCGEETAMLESIEGRRGVVRAKPPLPAISGLFGCPTVVNNLLTIATVPAILADGAAAYQRLGAGRSRGTQVFQLAGNIRHGGAFEAPFGVSLRELVEDIGGGTASGRPIGAVQVGGPLGSYLPPAALDIPLDYEAFVAADALVGHGGIVVFDDTVDMARQARFAMAFCAEESCGKCTPCRIGAVRGVEVIDRIIAGHDRDANLALLDDLCDVMTEGSLCAMGGLTPLPVRSALRHFPRAFRREVHPS